MKRLLLLIPVLFATLVMSGAAHAAAWSLTDTLPDPASNGPEIYLDIAKSGCGIRLDAPISYTKAYYANGTVDFKVNIIDGDYGADGASVDYGGWGGNVNRDAVYDLYPLDANGNIQGGKAPGGAASAVAGRTNATGDAVSRHLGNEMPTSGFEVNLTAENRQPTQRITSLGLYGVLIVAYWYNNSFCGRINGYKLQAIGTTGGKGGAGKYAYMGYVASFDDPFQNGTGSYPQAVGAMPLSLSGKKTIDFKSGVPCDFETNPAYNNTLHLRWQDADAGSRPGSSPANAGIGFTITQYRTDAGGNLVQVAAFSITDPADNFALGGNGEFRDLAFTRAGGGTYTAALSGSNIPGSIDVTGTIVAQSGVQIAIQNNDKFEWKWTQVLVDNHLQLWAPFDTIFGFINCTPARNDSICSWSGGIPGSVPAGSTFNAGITMQNSGTTTWTPGPAGVVNSYLLGTAQPHDNTIWGPSRYGLPFAVGPGGSVTFNATFTAPTAPGDYPFAFQMLQEGVEWFGGTCFTTITVSAINKASCSVIFTDRASYGAGDTINAVVQFFNSGSKDWWSGANYHMGEIDGVGWVPGARVWMQPNGYGNPTPEWVRPGQYATFSFAVTAPATQGTYPFSWQMVQDGVEWITGVNPVCSLNIPVTQPFQYTLDESSSSAVWGDPTYPVGNLDLTSGTINMTFLINPRAVALAFARTGDAYNLAPYLFGGGGSVAQSGTWGPGPWNGQPGIAPGGGASYYVRYNVPRTTPDGTVFCVYSGITPHASFDGGQLLSNILCYTIANPRYPYLTTSQGDVHAGAAPTCTLPGSTPNNIKGVTVLNQGSVGQFIVSAGGTITDFSSGGVQGSSGQSLPGYGTICRPDLIARAQQYRTDYGSVDPGASFAPTAYVPGTLASRLLYHVGPVTLQAGTISGRYSLVVIGDLTINGNLSYDGTPRALVDLPSLGIIVTGNVYISPGVTTMVGAVFANGTIDTCSPYQATNCNNSLFLDGSMYAKSFNFKRTGNGIQGGVDQGFAENIHGSTRLYIAPPPGFKDLAPIQSQSQAPNEKPPSY